MKNEIESDMKRSMSAYTKWIVPALLASTALGIQRVEATEKSMLDYNSGIDCVAMCSDGNVYGIDVKAQFITGDPRTFVIRASRNTGKRTTLAKLQSAREGQHAITPRWSVACYYSGSTLHGLWLCETDDLLYMIEQNLHDTLNGPNCTMAVVRIDDLLAENCRVVNLI